MNMKKALMYFLFSLWIISIHSETMKGYVKTYSIYCKFENKWDSMFKNSKIPIELTPDYLHVFFQCPKHYTFLKQLKTTFKNKDIYIINALDNDNGRVCTIYLEKNNKTIRKIYVLNNEDTYKYLAKLK